MQISATIVADSQDPRGNRLTTFLLVFPRIVLSELNTHRMFSRNSASSRAVPFPKMLKAVKENPFIPIRWMKEHSGMQGTEYFPEGPEHMGHVMLKEAWLSARDKALHWAGTLFELGLSKQMINRLLEPFMWHTALVTSSEWENFFAQRAADGAEIHLQDLAYKMLSEMNTHKPKFLQPGEWHVPFGDDMDSNQVYFAASNLWEQSDSIGSFNDVLASMRIKIAVARAARTSYTVIGTDQKHDYTADIKLHDRLISLKHFSPTEHTAQCLNDEEYYSHIKGVYPTGEDDYGLYNQERYPWIRETGLNTSNPDIYGWCHNYRGFKSYRSMLQGENSTDSRLKKWSVND